MSFRSCRLIAFDRVTSAGRKQEKPVRRGRFFVSAQAIGELTMLKGAYSLHQICCIRSLDRVCCEMDTRKALELSRGAMAIMKLLKLVAVALAMGLFAGQMARAAGVPAGANGDPGSPGYIEENIPVVGVYLSVKETGGSYVLAPGRERGERFRDILNRLARAHQLEPVLPVLTDILQEAMTAVRIAIHDGRTLSSIARMQGAKIVLAGRLQQTGVDQWRTSWSVSTIAGSVRWQMTGSSFTDALSHGLLKVSRVLSGKEQVVPYPVKVFPRTSLSLEEEERLSRQQETGETRPAARPAGD